MRMATAMALLSAVLPLLLLLEHSVEGQEAYSVLYCRPPPWVATAGVHYGSTDQGAAWYDVYMEPVEASGDNVTFVAAIPASQSFFFVIRLNGGAAWVNCGGSANTSMAACSRGDNFHVISPGMFVVTVNPSCGESTGIPCLGDISTAKAGPLTCPLAPSALGDEQGVIRFTPAGAAVVSDGPKAACSGNGRCNATLGCECFGAWTGVACEICNCGASEFCEAASGRCAADFPHNASNTTELLQQGAVVLLINVSGYSEPSWRESTAIYGNVHGLSTASEEWDFFPTSCVNLSDSRHIALVPEIAHYTNCDLWRVTVLPANAALFLVFTEAGQLYTHCSGVLPLDSGERSGARCMDDRHDLQNNFLAFAGVVTIAVAQTVQPAAMVVLREYGTGCQYGAPDYTSTFSAISARLARCSDAGECSNATSFNCVCAGNFSGAACSECRCDGPDEVCASGSGACVCRSGFDRCDGACINVQTDVHHCGSCIRDCIDGQEAFVEAAACVAGQCELRLRPKLGWTICFGDDDGADVACFKGYAFVVIAIVSGLLCAVCFWCWCVYRRHCPHSHKHRKLLFLLLVVIGGLRVCYSVISIVVIASISSPHSARSGKRFFEYSMITINAFADLVTGMVDLLLTAFWLFVLQRISFFPQRALLVAYTAMTSTLLLATIIDYQLDPVSFNYTFFTIAIVLFFTAILHVAVIAEVLLKLQAWSKLNSEGARESLALLRASGVAEDRVGGGPSRQSSARAMEAHHVARHFLRVFAIASVCAVCWGFRSVTLLGRATRKSIFVDGELSFANPDFTLVFYTVLSVLPCMIIAAAFFPLQLETLTVAAAGASFASDGSSAASRIIAGPSVRKFELRAAGHQPGPDSSHADQENKSFRVECDTLDAVQRQ